MALDSGRKKAGMQTHPADDLIFLICFTFSPSRERIKGN
jgi:hypothetical protein